MLSLEGTDWTKLVFLYISDSSGAGYSHLKGNRCALESGRSLPKLGSDVLSYVICMMGSGETNMAKLLPFEGYIFVSMNQALPQVKTWGLPLYRLRCCMKTEILRMRIDVNNGVTTSLQDTKSWMSTSRCTSTWEKNPASMSSVSGIHFLL